MFSQKVEINRFEIFGIHEAVILFNDSLFTSKTKKIYNYNQFINNTVHDIDNSWISVAKLTELNNFKELGRIGSLVPENIFLTCEIFEIFRNEWNLIKICGMKLLFYNLKYKTKVKILRESKKTKLKWND